MGPSFLDPFGFTDSVLSALADGPNAVNPNAMDLPGAPLSGAQSQNQPPAASQPTGGPMPPPAWTPQQNSVQPPPHSQPNMPPQGQPDPRANMPGGPVPPGPGPVMAGSGPPHQMPGARGGSSNPASSADMKKVYDALGLPYSQEGSGGGLPQLNQIPAGLGQTPGI